MRIIETCIVAVLLGFSTAAGAEVASSSPSAFVLHAEGDVAASPDEAWRAVTHPERWWNSAHTYSGDARNLRLEPRAGGCWCERWDGQSVEHMRVVAVLEREGVRTLRMVGGLGPLQELGVSGVLTFTVAPNASGAKITLTYRVTGDTGLALDRLAPLVDGVLMEQFSSLNRLVASD